MDGMLSQEEINALLNGDDSSSTDRIDEVLTDIQKDTIGEISNISMGTAATTLSSLVNQKVNITTPVVNISRWEDLEEQYDRPCVFLRISYREGLDGSNVLILKENDVKIIADLMMGGDGSNTDAELGELQLSAICEAMNQMMGSASTSLSSMLDMKVDISPPSASRIDLQENIAKEEIDPFLTEEFVRISFKMTIGDLVDSEIMQLFPLDFAATLCNKLIDDEQSQSEPEPISEPALTPEPTPTPVPQPVAPGPMPQAQGMPQAMPQMGMDQMGMPMGYPQMQPGYGMGQMGMPMGYPQMQQGYMGPMGMPGQNVNVQPAQFQAFSGDLAANTQQENIELIMDVPLEVTVELGRTKKSIQEILDFAPGTMIELDKIAGETMDVLVNGKLVAKGEVVVIEESFGVRVKEIIK